MFLRRLIWIIVIGTLVYLPGGAITAQAGQSAPLVMLKEGDLWEYAGGKLQQLTKLGFYKRPVISPNGRYVAYNLWCAELIQAVKTGKYLAQGDLPGDIGLLDISSGKAQLIATQPQTIDFSGDIPKNAIVRSAPTWSPDSTQIAWSEISLDQYVYSLVVYDLPSNKTTVIVAQLPTQFHAAELRTIRTLWGGGGLALFITRRDPAVGVLREIYIFDSNGNQRSVTKLEETIYDFMWIDDAGQAKVGLLYAQHPWTVIDPATGQTQPMNGVPEMYSPLADEYSVFIQPNQGNGQTGFTWMAASKTKGTVEKLAFSAETNFAHRITISADGIAWVADALHIWDGKDRVVKGTKDIAGGFEDPEAGAITWSPTAWRLRR